MKLGRLTVPVPVLALLVLACSGSTAFDPVAVCTKYCGISACTGGTSMTETCLKDCDANAAANPCGQELLATQECAANTQCQCADEASAYFMCCAQKEPSACGYNADGGA
jgi:hypothetical protein